jgi:hypothetical protein
MAPGIEELIHGGMLPTDVAYMYQSSSRISQAVKKRKSSRARCTMRAPTLWGGLVETVKETVVGEGRLVRSTQDVCISSLFKTNRRSNP